MKKIISYFLITAVLLAILPGCKKYMDVDYFFKDRLNIDSVFSKKDYSDQWLADTYTHLNGANIDVASKGLAYFNFISDDMFFGDRGLLYKTFKNGEYDEGNEQGSWGSCYEGIRKATIYIHGIDKNREMTKEQIADGKAQARFIRAYLYWQLLRKYGPIPLVPEGGVDYTLSYNDLALPRNTYDECVDFITTELAIAAKDLPLKRTTEFVRPTKGAALAARAKVYLFAASPEFNGNTEMSGLTDDKGRQLISQQVDNSKWAKAAAAAKDVIDLNVYKLFTVPFSAVDISIAQRKTIVPPYNAKYSNSNFPNGWADIDPQESYAQMFNGGSTFSSNSEIIFSRITNTSTVGTDVMAQHQTPYSMKGWNCHGITQKQCDAYYMNDGSDIPAIRPTGFTTNDVDYLPLPANVSLQYANREPRFYASVAYNGCIWYQLSALDKNNQMQQIFYYRGAPDGKQPASPDFYVRTGIGIKKYVHPVDCWDASVTGHYVVPKFEPAIRYAEVLLIYAEALNELSGNYTIPDYQGKMNYTVSRDIAEMSKAISQIRIRGGVPDFADNIYASQALFRKALKRERQIELMGENHRYYDLRRWKDAPIEEATPVVGCNMDMTANQRDLFHTPVIVSSLPTVFVQKMYLWPISYDELKRNKRLTQNPGWTTP